MTINTDRAVLAGSFICGFTIPTAIFAIIISVLCSVQEERVRMARSDAWNDGKETGERMAIIMGPMSK